MKREEVAGWMMEDGARDDPVAAGEWLRVQEPSASRDVATASYVHGLVAEDPALAAQWSETISSRRIRNRSRERLYQRWRERHPEAAGAWKAEWE